MARTIGVLPAAGRAIRAGGSVKELTPISPDHTAMSMAHHQMSIAGVSLIAVVVSPAKAPVIMSAFPRFLPHPAYVVQTEPRGLGDAILQTKHLFGSDDIGVMMMPDTVIEQQNVLLQLVNWQQHHDFVATVALHRVMHPEQMGCAVMAGDRPTGFVDKPADRTGLGDQTWCWTAAAFSPAFFDHVSEHADYHGPEVGEHGLTEVFDYLAKRELLGWLMIDGSFSDLGTWQGLHEYLAP
jgi:dTDP-glucose pyrophosphorylase